VSARPSFVLFGLRKVSAADYRCSISIAVKYAVNSLSVSILLSFRIDMGVAVGPTVNIELSEVSDSSCLFNYLIYLINRQYLSKKCLNR